MESDKDKLRSGTLSNRNDLYQKMIEEIQDYAILLMDKNGIIQSWNKGVQEIKRYAKNEIIGKHFSIFYLPEALANNLPQKLMNEALATGRAAQEGWRVRKDGTKFWGSVTMTALHDDNNAVIGFSKVTRDLTDKKIAEDELRKSEERYHQMIAEVQDYAIILLDQHGIIQNWNAGAEKIKGYSAKEAIGKRFDLFYTSEDRAINLPDKLLLQAKELGKALQEGWRVRKNGTKFWGSITITALHDEQKSVIGFSKVTRDLTDKKIAEDKVIAYNAELQLQNSELEQFAYVASHDLQEPLRKIQTFAELIQENYSDQDFVKKYFAKIDSSAQRMAELIKSLLYYSRLSKDSGSKRSEIEDVDLNAVLTDVLQDFELLISEREATIISEKLPVIRGSRMQLEQLFSNLISNSLKFSKVKPVIQVTVGILDRTKMPSVPGLLPYKKYFQISFEDNGIGFEQQYNKIIFSLFQRLHGKQDYAGTGIGLALCKKIAENHNGLITASSELNKGARFNVYIPVS